MSSQADTSRNGKAEPLDSEVAARVTRRRITADQKARLLEEYEKASAIDRAALCRREHIYSSHIANWRKQRSAGKYLDAKRGRKPDALAVENTRLRKEKGELEQRLAKAEQIIDVQGKVYALVRAVAGKSADEMDATFLEAVRSLEQKLNDELRWPEALTYEEMNVEDPGAILRLVLKQAHADKHTEATQRQRDGVLMGRRKTDPFSPRSVV
jgi:transposase